MHIIEMKYYMLLVAQLYCFYADIYSLGYSGIAKQVVNTVSNCKWLLMFNSSMGNDCVEVFKCHVMICSSFVYLTKKC